jgi:energy-coupling factor transporter ATP-binding protein EcfA2
LVGANGSGKSTFARLACGLDLPSGGSFSLDGKEATPTMLQRNVGYLFQNPDLQIFLPTVREELSWSLDRDKRISKAEKERRVKECADLFGLCLNDTPTTMSYPERKALQAAVYYLLDRPFYILDELDNALTYAKAQMIVRLLQKNGSGLLIITHDRKFAALVAEKGFAIQEGRLIAL